MIDGSTRRTGQEDNGQVREGLYGGRLLNARDAARTLGISERMLWTIGNRGEIPRVKIGRAVRYDPADLRAWIEKQKTKTK